LEFTPSAAWFQGDIFSIGTKQQTNSLKKITKELHKKCYRKFTQKSVAFGKLIKSSQNKPQH
jgi:hypothetical protein